MDAIEKLIEQAHQEEIDRQQAAEIFESVEREEIFQKCQETASYIGIALGPGWEELKPFMIEKYNDNGSVEYQLSEQSAVILEMVPFNVWTTMEGSVIHFIKQDWDRRCFNQKDFARFLMFFRDDFPDWNDIRLTKICLQELQKIYEYDLIAWKKECELVMERNQNRIAETQAMIPSFEVYDLEFSNLIRDVEYDHYKEQHAWVLNFHQELGPNGDGYYQVIENGNVSRKKFFYPISVNAEAVVIEPGPGIDLCCKKHLDGGILYYGPNIDIAEYLPNLEKLPEKPIAPEGLPEWDRVQIETKIESA